MKVIIRNIYDGTYDAFTTTDYDAQRAMHHAGYDPSEWIVEREEPLD